MNWWKLNSDNAPKEVNGNPSHASNNVSISFRKAKDMSPLVLPFCQENYQEISFQLDGDKTYQIEDIVNIYHRNKYKYNDSRYEILDDV